MSDPQQQVSDFLHALFDHATDSWIEIRLLGEQVKPTPTIRRAWFKTVDQLVQELPALNEEAVANKAGVFFGVMPRAQENASKPQSAGVAAWVDLDLRDFPNGGALASLSNFHCPPSVTVATGYGLQAYWLFHDPLQPATLGSISAGLGRALNGQPIADQERILRMPGSHNMRLSPISVSFEALEIDKRYEEHDFSDLPATAPTHPKPTIEIGKHISPVLWKQIAENSHVAKNWIGQGTTEKNETGHHMARSPEGYDFSLVAKLVKFSRIRDMAELGTALWYRDSSVRVRGTAYVERVVRAVLATVKPPSGSNGNGHSVERPDWTKYSLVVEDSAEPIYWLVTPDKKRIRFSSEQLLTPREFQRRLFEGEHRVFDVPNKKDLWHPVVNAWMGSAEHVAQPPEASEEIFNKQAVLRLISTAGQGERIEDLYAGKIIVRGEDTIVRTETVIEMLRRAGCTTKPREACSLLRSLGFVSQSIRIEGEVVKAWIGSQKNQDAV